LNDEHKRNQLGEAALKTIQQKFSLTQVAHQYQQLYQALLN
jgi:hypothetical protein